MHNYTDPYVILGVSRFATPDEIKKAFLEVNFIFLFFSMFKNLNYWIIKKAKKYHPDICKDPDSHEKFLLYKKAYEQIKKGKVEETNHNNYNYNNQYRYQYHYNYSNPNYRYRQQYYQYSSQYNSSYGFNNSSYYNKNYDENVRQHRENMRVLLEPVLHYLLIGFLVTLTIISMMSGMSNHSARATRVTYEPSRYTGPIRVAQMSPTSFSNQPRKRNVKSSDEEERIRRKRREEFYHGIQR